jgi:hypothetical protein
MTTPQAPSHPAWPKDTAKDLTAFYGNPAAKGWAAANLVKVPVPWGMTYGGQPVRTILIHRKCADSLKRVMDAIWSFYGQNQATLNTTGLQRYSGSYNYRPVRGSTTKLSCHAYGAAIDWDAAHLPLGDRTHRLPDPVVNAFKAEGLFYGGDFKTRPDPMHVQFTTGA